MYRPNFRTIIFQLFFYPKLTKIRYIDFFCIFDANQKTTNMAAPKGNEFWRKAKNFARPRKYTAQELWEKACDYFESCDNSPWMKVEQLRKPIVTTNDKGEEETITTVELPTQKPYTIGGFCIFCGCSRHWWNELRTNSQSPDKQEYLEVMTRIEDIIYTQKFEGAAVGAFNANIIARDLGLADKKEIELPKKIKVGFSKPEATETED